MCCEALDLGLRAGAGGAGAVYKVQRVLLLLWDRRVGVGGTGQVDKVQRSLLLSLWGCRLIYCSWERKRGNGLDLQDW